MMVGVSCVCCLVAAVYLALQTVVLSDLAGMSHLPVAMGILLAGHGLSSLLLHPVAGKPQPQLSVSSALSTLGMSK